MRLTGVRLDERGAWELELANGVQVRLGRQAVNERLERFIAAREPAGGEARRRNRLRGHALHERIQRRLERAVPPLAVGCARGRDPRWLRKPNET